MLLMQFAGLGAEKDREQSLNYCGNRFGYNTPDFMPCVNWYVNDRPGDYQPTPGFAPLSNTPSGSGGGYFPQSQPASGGFVMPFTNPFAPSTLMPGMPGYGLQPGMPGYVAPTPWYSGPMGIMLLAGAALIAYKVLLSD